MSVSLLSCRTRWLAQGAALLLLGVTAGCSSSATRFTDGLVTSSTTPSQPMNSQLAPVSPEETYSISQAPSAPSGGAVERAQLSAPSSVVAAAPMPAAQPVQTAQLQRPIDPLSRSVERDGGVQTLPSRSPETLRAPVETAKKAAVAEATSKLPAGAYKVESGDTLSGVARKYGVSVAALKQANGIDDGSIRIGQTLRIPGATTPVVAEAKPVAPKLEEAKPAPVLKAETPKAAQPQETEKPKLAAYTPPTSGKAVADAARAEAEAPDDTGIGKMRWPVKGRVISGFGKGSGNARDGIDIQVPPGTPVKAAENGVVIYAGDGLKDFGNTVLVRHENGLVTVYGNASELKVKRGQKVRRGEDIALSGVSASTNTPKLHFEVRKDAAAVDPSGYLQ
ncbi:MAG: peptidoglycan DD-metalloendopeptidase family protein [Rhizobiaceae bacterium]|nr:peptidoglycan DD-metalloendopeptidase family protein [Rhizobiaceae bacterium]